MNHSINLNAKIYNSSLSARCLEGYTRKPQVKKATFMHTQNFFFFGDNLIVGSGGIWTLDVPYWKHQEVSTSWATRLFAMHKLKYASRKGTDGPPSMAEQKLTLTKAKKNMHSKYR